MLCVSAPSCSILYFRQPLDSVFEIDQIQPFPELEPNLGEVANIDEAKGTMQSQARFLITRNSRDHAVVPKDFRPRKEIGENCPTNSTAMEILMNSVR